MAQRISMSHVEREVSESVGNVVPTHYGVKLPLLGLNVFQKQHHVFAARLAKLVHASVAYAGFHLVRQQFP